MLLTDSHCHLDFDTFSNEQESLLKQCYRLGIHRIIVPAVSPDNWDKVLAFSKDKNNNNTYKLSTSLPDGIQQRTTQQNTEDQTTQEICQVFPCLGIHPWFMKSLDNTALENLTRYVEKHSKCIVAIGETGIDKVIADEQKNINQQISFFEHHLNLSKQYNLPVIVHHRRSHDIIIPLLKRYKLDHSGVIHAFSGSYQQAKSYIDLGFKLGVGGTITYERAQKTIKAIKKLPLDSLLLETDAPSMPLQGSQGEDNSPTQLINVLHCLSELRPESLAVIAQTIENNVNALFFNR